MQTEGGVGPRLSVRNCANRVTEGEHIRKLIELNLKCSSAKRKVLCSYEWTQVLKTELIWSFHGMTTVTGHQHPTESISVKRRCKQCLLKGVVNDRNSGGIWSIGCCVGEIAGEVEHFGPICFFDRSRPVQDDCNLVFVAGCKNHR